MHGSGGAACDALSDGTKSVIRILDCGGAHGPVSVPTASCTSLKR